MAITLQYRGPLLSSNGKDSKKKNKHALRKTFHGQLKRLWDNPPMDLYGCSVSGERFERGSFSFAAIASKLCATCELEIRLITQSKPGGILQDGDLDNRLKTIFDSLRVPTLGELPHEQPSADQKPFYVLLEDDRQVTDVCVHSVKSNLAPENEVSAYAEILIDAKIKTLNRI